MDVHSQYLKAMEELTEKVKEVKQSLEKPKPKPAPVIIRRQQWASASKKD